MGRTDGPFTEAEPSNEADEQAEPPEQSEVVESVGIWETWHMGMSDAQARGFGIGAGERERKREVIGSLSGARWKQPQSTGDGVAEIRIGLFGVSPTARDSDSSTLIGSRTMSRKLAMACRAIWRSARGGKGEEEGEG